MTTPYVDPLSQAFQQAQRLGTSDPTEVQELPTSQQPPVQQPGSSRSSGRASIKTWGSMRILLPISRSEPRGT
jgi:hypothetical protein